jgi:TonB family protein
VETRGHIIGFVVVFVHTVCIIGCGGNTPREITLSTTGHGAEAFASSLVRPAYPADSVQHRVTGLAVVAIDVAEDGTVHRATLLQAPDTATGSSALDAAKRSTFHLPQGLGGNISGKGKLFFYFMMDPSARVIVPGEGAN